MKKIKSFVIAALLTASANVGIAQINQNADPGSTGINWVPGTITIGQTATLTLVLGNFGTDPIPANSINWIINLPRSVEFTSMSLAGTPFVEFYNSGYSNIDGTSITLRNNVPINPPAVVGGVIQPSAFQFDIVTTGVMAGSNLQALFNASTVLGMGSQVGNTNGDNDNARSFLTVQATTPVPVKLISFNAKEKSCGTVLLNWETANEQNVDKFDIEFSADGRKFDHIKTVKANNKAGANQYSTSVNQSTKEGFYRLKIVDVDKKYNLSDATKIVLSCVDRVISVVPNPATSKLTIASLNANETIQFVNAVGQVVIEQKSKEGENVLNIDHLPAGNYNLIIVDNYGAASTFKVVKM